MINLAILGATGLVGQKMRKILAERNFKFDNIYFFASNKSAGQNIYFKGKKYTILELNEENLLNNNINYALSALDSNLAKTYVTLASENGITVVDNSSAFRMDPSVPLVVPEINPEKSLNSKGIIANPNCSTIQSVVALNPIYRKFGIKRIVYTTYQAVAGSGINGIEDLILGDWGGKNKFYPHQISHNAIPHIDDFTENGYSKEELKMVNESRKILNDDSLKITATAVRVPIFESHMVNIIVETEKPFEMNEIYEAFEKAEGVIVQDDLKNNIYPMPITAAGKDEVFVGRIRRDMSVENGINFICVSDNTRKGAALNAIQILEYVIANN